MPKSELSGYSLSRIWFDFCFENPEKIKPTHTALYFFIIEHCNRLGWKEKFGLPTTMSMEALGIKSYNTYINTFKDLVEFGFIRIIEKSKNQYSSNIIALSNFNKAQVKALDKALLKHVTKHVTKQRESTSSINKPLTNNHKPLTNNNRDIELIFPFFSEKFKTAWKDWIEYKKNQFRFKYATPRSEQIALNALSRLSCENEKTAINIIENSISSGYKGLFPDKEEKKNGKQVDEDRNFPEGYPNGIKRENGKEYYWEKNQWNLYER